jgi:hypothetical protein
MVGVAWMVNGLPPDRHSVDTPEKGSREIRYFLRLVGTISVDGVSAHAGLFPSSACFDRSHAASLLSPCYPNVQTHVRHRSGIGQARFFASSWIHRVLWRENSKRVQHQASTSQVCILIHRLRYSPLTGPRSKRLRRK